jgi:hypothetical protein
MVIGRAIAAGANTTITGTGATTAIFAIATETKHVDFPSD